MDLDTSHVYELGKIISSAPKDYSQSRAAIVTRVDGDSAWVIAPGDKEPVPIKNTTAQLKVGDVVVVRWQGGNLRVDGNTSRPSTDDAKAVEAYNEALESAKSATDFLKVLDSGTGLKIHAKNREYIDYLTITPSGIDLYKGGSHIASYGSTARFFDTDGNVVARFGDNIELGVRGLTSRVQVNESSIQMLDADGAETLAIESAAATVTKTNSEYSAGLVGTDGKNYSSTYNTVTYTITDANITGLSKIVLVPEGMQSATLPTSRYTYNVSTSEITVTITAANQQWIDEKHGRGFLVGLYIYYTVTGDSSVVNIETSGTFTGGIADNFATTWNEIELTSFAGGGYISDTLVIEKSGYKPIGVCGWTTSARAVHMVRAYITSATSGSGNLSYMVHNVLSSTISSVTVQVVVLWAKA